jgi:phosphoribosylamine--glycine ligase
MTQKKILIVGGGGREHALAWKCAASSQAEEVIVAPGNAGTAREPGVRNAAIAAEDIPALARFAREQAVDLTIVGPEAPLAAGIVDVFKDNGLACLGPDRAAAQLEASKAFTKAFLTRHHIPTAEYGVFDAPDAAAAFIRRLGAPVVVKADGLAAGKGVVIASTVAEAVEGARQMLRGNLHGAAGRRIVVEEFLAGEEATFTALVDGQNVLPLASSQDHKTIGEGETGANTGGMGAYSPAPVLTGALYERVLDEIVRPTVAGMAADGRPYRGFLYAGLMIDGRGKPKVLEYNVRLGDPETQPLLMRLRSDLVTLGETALSERLDTMAAEWDPRPALGVVMAAGGYPDSYRKDDAISGLNDGDAPDTKVFHAGTRSENGRVLTSSGRVLCVCALGESVTQAQARAYAEVDKIHWQGANYRRDIGYRAVEREKAV